MTQDWIPAAIAGYITIGVLWGLGMWAALDTGEEQLAWVGGILWPIFLPICVFAAIAKASRA